MVFCTRELSVGRYSTDWCSTKTWAASFRIFFILDEIRCYSWKKTKCRRSEQKPLKYRSHDSSGFSNISAATNYHFIFCISFWLKYIFQKTPKLMLSVNMQIVCPGLSILNTKQPHRTLFRKTCMTICFFIPANQRWPDHLFRQLVITVKLLLMKEIYWQLNVKNTVDWKWFLNL